MRFDHNRGQRNDQHEAEAFKHRAKRDQERGENAGAAGECRKLAQELTQDRCATGVARMSWVSSARALCSGGAAAPVIDWLPMPCAKNGSPRYREAAHLRIIELFHIPRPSSKQSRYHNTRAPCITMNAFDFKR